MCRCLDGLAGDGSPARDDGAHGMCPEGPWADAIKAERPRDLPRRGHVAAMAWCRCRFAGAVMDRRCTGTGGRRPTWGRPRSGR